MEKFSSTYGGTIGNYVILNIPKADDSYKTNYTIEGLLSVVMNILQRGNVSKPSIYLQSRLGNSLIL